jgi:hypothetical protein
MPINLLVSPTLNKERRILIDRKDVNGKKKPWENNQLSTFKWAGYMPFVCEN